MQQCYVAIKDDIVNVVFSYDMRTLEPECGDIENIEERIAYLETKGYIIDTLAHFYSGNMINSSIIMDNNRKFKNVTEAATYLIQNKYSKTTLKTTSSYINRVLTGKIKSYLGHTFKEEKENFHINNVKEIIFL